MNFMDSNCTEADYPLLPCSEPVLTWLSTILEEKVKRASTYYEVGQRGLGEMVGEHFDLLSSWVKTRCL